MFFKYNYRNSLYLKLKCVTALECVTHCTVCCTEHQKCVNLCTVGCAEYQKCVTHCTAQGPHPLSI